MGERFRNCPNILERKLFKNKYLRDGHLYSVGDLNTFRVLFSAVFHVFPREISIRVETCGSERKLMCGKLWSIYVQSFYVFGDSLPFHGDVENPIRLCAQSGGLF